MMLRKLLLAFILTSVSFSGSPPDPPLVKAVDSVGITVSDLDRSILFYSDVLGFRKIAEYESSGDAEERSRGVFGARVRVARMLLGAEMLELTEYLAPQGRAYPADSRSNDFWFQHVAIVVSDMAKAYEHLRSHKVRHASAGPQRLPDWNEHAGGIEAFYFKDPDGHVLEVLSFPPGKGESRWKGASDRLFLGIDHTAIVISETEASLRFYRDTLGLRVAGASENYGIEQERLNNVFGARLRITTLRAASGPGVEFLEYLAPRDGRQYPADSRANDLWHWQTRFTAANLPVIAERIRKFRAPFVSAGITEHPDSSMSGFRRSVAVRDPDGHAIQIVEPDGSGNNPINNGRIDQ